MKRIVLSGQMKEADQRMIGEAFMPGCLLMEHAALAVCETVKKNYPDVKRVGVICGSGNNGGDGFAVARLLKQNSVLTEVFFAGKRSSMTDDCLMQANIWEHIGGITVQEFWPDQYDLVIDALFGIGLTRAVEGSYASLIEKANASLVPVVAVDLPSGIDADTGAVMGIAIQAEHTVTFSALKPGLLLHPGCDYCGFVHLADIGILPEMIAQDPCMFTYEKNDLSALLPQRRVRSNKGIYGRAMIVGGCCGMAGALLLSGSAAYRSGCGLTAVVSDPQNRTILQAGLPEAIYSAWDEEAVKEQLLKATAVAVGPGLGTGEHQQKLLDILLREYGRTLVLDADALNIISNDPVFWLSGNMHPGQKRIITPHPGEMSRLLKKPVREILDDTIACAKDIAKTYRVIVVLKDDKTIVTDGDAVYINTSGCDGMASGGSGDVLTGIITSFCAQGLSAFEAATLGVYVHGLAGQSAQKNMGERSMLAGDTVKGIEEVLRAY